MGLSPVQWFFLAFGQALRQVGRGGPPLARKKAPHLQAEDGPGREEGPGNEPRRMLRGATTLFERREFLEKAADARVSDSTVSLTLKCMGFSRNQLVGSGGARGVIEVRLADYGLRNTLS
jgi:hypothetical protein